MADLHDSEGIGETVETTRSECQGRDFGGHDASRIARRYSAGGCEWRKL
jgi:hypothetical protein